MLSIIRFYPRPLTGLNQRYKRQAYYNFAVQNRGQTFIFLTPYTVYRVPYVVSRTKIDARAFQDARFIDTYFRINFMQISVLSKE